MATTSITPEQDVVTAEIFIAAPPQRVFEALTDPKQAPQWWGQEGLYRITEYRGDVRVGGKWASLGMGADGKEFRVYGEYLEIDPPRRLVYTWIASFMVRKKPPCTGSSSRAMFMDCSRAARERGVRARW